MGSLLEANYKSKLDSLQTLLTELCKDESLELVLRLKVLEVIELRTMGWRASSSAAQYYRERIPQVEDRQQRRRTQQTPARPSSNSVTPPSVGSIGSIQARGDKEGEDLRFQTSVKELFPNTNIRERECVVVDGVKIFLSSASPELLKEAKAVLAAKLHRGPKSSSSSSVQYSREDLLSLARSPSSSQPPVKWPGGSVSCPEILCKVRILSFCLILSSCCHSVILLSCFKSLFQLTH